MDVIFILVALGISAAPGEPLMRFVPTGTNSASGQANWIFSQSIDSSQSTNSQIIYAHGFNYENGRVVDTNKHAWFEVWELNWQPFDGYPPPADAIRQIEHYVVFIERITGRQHRYRGEVLRDGEIEQNTYGRYIWWGHPNRVNQPAISMTIKDAASGDVIGKGSAEMEIHGKLDLISTTNLLASISLTPGPLTTYAPSISVANAAGTKSVSIYGSGEGFEQYGVGLAGQALIWAGQDILRVMAARQILMSTNLAVFGDVSSSNVITKGLTFNDTTTACPTNPLIPTKWLPFTNNGARYYLPAYQ